MKRSNLIKLLAALSLLMAVATFLVARPATPAVAKGLWQTTTTMTLTQTVNKPTGIMPGDTLVYQYYVKNTGATTATAVSLSDTLPSQLSLVNTQADKGLMQSAWPMFHQNPQHTGRSIHYGPITNTVRCTYNIGSVIASSPAIAQDGTVYVGADDGKLYAFTPNCALKWSYATGDIIKSSPAIAVDGTVYVGSNDDYLYAINPNGSLKWRYLTAGDVQAPPTIAGDGTIYVGSYDWYFYAIQPDMTLRWRRNSGGQITYYASAAIAPTGPNALTQNDTIYFNQFWASNPNFYAVSSDNVVRWSTYPSKYVTSPAIGNSGKIYFAAADIHTHQAYNPADGSLAWSPFQTDGTQGSPALGVDETMYIGIYNGSYPAVQAINSNGTSKWKSLVVPNSAYSSPALDAGGSLYIGTELGDMYSLNSTDGSLRWKYSVGTRIYSSPAIGPDGTIYFGSDNGTFYGVGPGQAGVPENPWTVSLGSIAPNETRIITVTIQVSNSTTTGSIINNTATVMAANSTTVNDTHVITIALDPPTLNAITSPDSDGNYPITWNSVSGATGYTLERDDNAGFTTPEVAYTGSLTTHNEASRTPGTWYYRVKASNAGGDSAWSNTVSAEVITPPQANFEVSPLTAEVNQTIYFTNTSVGSYTTVLYDFGDNTVSGSSNATHSYTNTGTKIITLTVSGYATSSTISKSVTIGTACTASFTLDRTDGAAPLTLTATDTSTGDCPTTTWHWGEGLVTNLLTHTYDTPGNFTIMLTKTGGMGTVVTQSNIVVYPRAQATITAAPVTGEVPLTVTFTSRMTDVVSFAWNFGDGSPVETFLTNPTHVYTQGGNFNATLTVTGTGTGNSASQTVVITPTSTLKPLFTFTPPSGIVPPDAQICFNNDSTPVDAASSWNFGDGSPADTNRNPCHFYKTAGIYTVILTISKGGQSATAKATVSIYNQCKADFIFSPPSPVYINQTVQFTQTATGDCSTALWAFDDGSSSTQTNPTHVYAQVGTYPITLTMQGNGGKGETIKYIKVIMPPQPAITAQPDSGDAPLAVQFGLTGTADYPTVKWEFDDGANSSQSNPPHTFMGSKRTVANEVQPYIVTATLTGQKGSLIITRPITVTVSPQAYFQPSPRSGVTPLAVTIDNKTTGDIATYLWDLGQGQSSTAKVPPAQTYLATPMVMLPAGVLGHEYTVVLTATGLSGKVSRHQETVTVYEPCVADFRVTTATKAEVPPLQVNLENRSTNCTQFSWEFGDGARDDVRQPGHLYTQAGKFTLKVTAHGPANSSQKEVLIEVGNPVCRASHVKINPELPRDNDDLIVDYAFGCSQRQQAAEGVRLQWLLNGQPVPAFDRTLGVTATVLERTLPATVTMPFDKWKARVTPFKGSLEGSTTESVNEVYIDLKPNTPPTVTVAIAPLSPVDDSVLTLTYQYHDADGDAEQVAQTQIFWLLGNQLQPAYTALTLPAEATTPQETWCATVRVTDGQEYSPIAPPACVTIGTGQNHPPQLFTPTLMVQRQSVGSLLQVTGIYSDVDSPCPYCNRRIETLPMTTTVQTQWFRDDKLQSEFNNQTEITRSVTFTGEQWHVTVQLFDGIDYSAIAKTPPVIFRDVLTNNTPPQVDNVQIIAIDSKSGRQQPGDPTDSDNLQVRYDFSDPDGQPERGSQIYWYNPFTRVVQYDGLLTIPYSDTQANQIWFVRVIPCDGLDCGSYGDSDSVQIRPDSYNTPPTVSNLRLIPPDPSITMPLELHYDFNDVDRGDTEGRSLIRWTRNSTAESRRDDLTLVPALMLNEKDTWCVKVTPVDIRGAKGAESAAVCATVQAKPNVHSPKVTNVYLSSTNQPSNQARKPTDSENLELHYDFIDDDCAQNDYRTCEHDSKIVWYRNGQPESDFNNITVVSATRTAPGDKWYATVRPHDGEHFGDMVTSPVITINQLPKVTAITFTPTQPIAGQVLTATCLYTDADNDPASTLTYRWSRDGVVEPLYEGQSRLPAQITQAGQAWTVSCTPHDGIELGQTITATVNIKGKGYIYLPLIIKTATTPTPATPLPTNTPGPAFETISCNPQANYEPNNERSQACLLQLGQSYSAFANDTLDYYVFSSPETAAVKIELTGLTQGKLLVYSSYQTTTTLVEQDLSQANTIPNVYIPQALVDLSPGNNYYILVNNDLVSNQPYQLKITALPKED